MRQQLVSPRAAPVPGNLASGRPVGTAVSPSRQADVGARGRAWKQTRHPDNAHLPSGEEEAWGGDGIECGVISATIR